MLSHNYLAVRLVRLGCGEAWQPPNNDFFFFFLLERSGHHSDGKLIRQLGQGDVLVLRQSSGQNRFTARRSGMVLRRFSFLLEQLFPLFDVSELSLLNDVVEGLGSQKLYPSSAPQAMECQRLLADVPCEFDLKHPNVKITNVAEQCGFNRLGQFNARFKRRFGVSPGQWRKQSSYRMGEINEEGQRGQNGVGIFKRSVSRSVDTRPNQSSSSARPIQLGENKSAVDDASSSHAASIGGWAGASNWASNRSFELIESQEC
jgi:AraC-like DNA-binding protein